ncbi:MAG: glycosyltransferase family 2 protein [bacterium]
MFNGKKIVVVMPAYNAEKTLRQTFEEIDKEIIDEVILVDDKSNDKTIEIARELKITTILHKENKGYGGNQKSCYSAALRINADIVIMVHPDYQYSPKLIPAIASMIAFDEYDCVLASRILCGGALKGGMPLYKYIANRFLTFAQNICMNQSISEYHTGYRGFSRKIFENLPLKECSDDFSFDNEILAQICFNNYRIGEISCPTKYFKDASSINFLNSVKYGLKVLKISFLYFLAKNNIWISKIFRENGRKIDGNEDLFYYYHSMADYQEAI